MEGGPQVRREGGKEGGKEGEMSAVREGGRSTSQTRRNVMFGIQICALPAPWLPSFLATTPTVGEESSATTPTLGEESSATIPTVGEESSQGGITLLTELLLAVHICACAAQHARRSKFRVQSVEQDVDTHKRAREHTSLCSNT